MSLFGQHEPLPGEEPRPGFAGWKLLVWAAALLFVANVIALATQRPQILGYEMPSREALEAGRYWTVLTYALAEAHWFLGPLGILLLGIIGQLVESFLPRRTFLLLCAGCALGGALLWLPLHWNLGDALQPGCAVLVLGLLSFWSFTTPDETVPVKLFFLLPVRPRAFFWLLLALVTAALLTFELPAVLGVPSEFDPAGFSTSALLGSMLAGWLFAQLFLRAHRDVADFAPPADEAPAPGRWPRADVPVTAGRAATERADTPAPARNATPRPLTKTEWRAEVDRILDKINTEGFDSLSPDERRILDRAKDKMGK